MRLSVAYFYDFNINLFAFFFTYDRSVVTSFAVKCVEPTHFCLSCCYTYYCHCLLPFDLDALQSVSAREHLLIIVGQSTVWRDSLLYRKQYKVSVAILLLVKRIFIGKVIRMLIGRLLLMILNLTNDFFSYLFTGLTIAHSNRHIWRSQRCANLPSGLLSNQSILW